MIAEEGSVLEEAGAETGAEEEVDDEEAKAEVEDGGLDELEWVGDPGFVAGVDSSMLYSTQYLQYMKSVGTRGASYKTNSSQRLSN